MDATYLLVNADDFGQSHGINRGVMEACERGVVTSASLMVRWPAAREAVEAARGRGTPSLGLHVDLGEWAYRVGRWVALYDVVPLDDPAVVEAEVWRQIDAFRALVEADPTHLDSHQHVHRYAPARTVLLRAARRLKVPLRHYSSIRYRGDFYGQAGAGVPIPGAITAEVLAALVHTFEPGVTELACHPGYGGPPGSMYCVEREQELRALCDPRFAEALSERGVRLLSHHDLRRLPGFEELIAIRPAQREPAGQAGGRQ